MTADTDALMLAAIGSSISGARAVGMPDPTDDDLTLDLSAAGIAAIDIRDHMPRIKALALETLRDLAALASLALFLTAGGIWAGILRGVI
jgi:hypothetical protein